MNRVYEKNICSNIQETKKRAKTVPNTGKHYGIRKGTINVMLFF